MNESSISRRYAKALFELAVQANRIDEVARQLETVGQVISQDRELLTLLRSPSLDRADRSKMAEVLISGISPDPFVADGIRLLADRQRLADLSRIAHAFGEMADQKAGRLRAELSSAVPLADATTQAIVQKLSHALGHEVVVQTRVDPSLLGGVVAQVGSLTFDGSLKAQLDELKRQLKGC